MKSSSIPFFANFLGSGSGGSVRCHLDAALDRRRRQPEWERSVLMSYFASTSFSVSACGAAAAGAMNLDVL